MSDCSDAAGNGLQYGVDKPDCFAVDLGSFPSGIDREFPANSRIVVKLQKSLSRKGSQRGSEKKHSFCTSAVDEERGGVIMGTIEKAASVTGGCTEPQHPASPSQLVQHQIRITTPTAISGTSPPSTAEGNRVLKRSGSRRSPPRGLDPRRVLLFFATLSVMGTTLLLLFTLSMDNKQGADDDTLGW